MRYQPRLPLLLALMTAACASYQPRPLVALPAATRGRALSSDRRLQSSGARPALGARAPLPIDLNDGLDPDEAAVLAVLLNPDLIAVRDTRGEGKAQLILAGVLPNPIFAAEFAHPYGANSSGTTNALNLSLSYEIKPLITAATRRSAARAQLAQTDLAVAFQEWQVAQQARLLVTRLGWLRHRVQLARDELQFQQQTLQALEQASETADATLQQLGVQRAALEAVRHTLDDLEQSELDADGELRALLGAPALPTLDVTPPSAPQPRTGPSIDACLAGRLDLEALRRGYRAQELQVRADVLAQFPALTVGVTHQRNEGALAFVGAFVNVELPMFNRNQGAIALSYATRQRLEHEYDARVLSARAELERLLRLSELLARQLRIAHESLAPLQAVEAQERTAVTRGDIDRLSYQTVRMALFDQRLQEAALSQALAEAQVGLQTSCGRAKAHGGKP